MNNQSSVVYKTSMFLLLISLTMLSVFVNNTGSGLVNLSTDPKFQIGEDSACITGIPYSWQEINGFCHWASITMALHCAGVELTLHELFAISGIGFSMAYVRFNETMTILPGAMFRQPAQFLPICELYGLSYEMYLDQNAAWTDVFIDAWNAWGVKASHIDGQAEAFSILKDTIDDGYPVVVWTDPYYLPAVDYDIARELGLKQDPSAPYSGHSILAVGYNDTSETVQVMDPGVGAFGEQFGYPDDGRWSYFVNYTTLDNAWSTLGYGITIVKPESGIIPDFSKVLAENTVDRLRGERKAYAEDSEDIFFVNFGESAFRGLSYDMTVDGIKSFIEQFENPEEQFIILAVGGFDIEASLTLQYLSFRTALEALPKLLPDLEPHQFLEAGRSALPHMAELSQNGTLTDIYIGENYDSLLTNTFMGIALDFQESGNLDSALEAHSEGITEIADHLLAIADAWESAANALEAAFQELPYPQIIAAIAAIGGIFVVTVVFMVRRKSRN